MKLVARESDEYRATLIFSDVCLDTWKSLEMPLRHMVLFQRYLYYTAVAYIP
jgi:hypothetical protein